MVVYPSRAAAIRTYPEPERTRRRERERENRERPMHEALQADLQPEYAAREIESRPPITARRARAFRVF